MFNHKRFKTCKDKLLAKNKKINLANVKVQIALFSCNSKLIKVNPGIHISVFGQLKVISSLHVHDCSSLTDHTSN